MLSRDGDALFWFSGVPVGSTITVTKSGYVWPVTIVKADTPEQLYQISGTAGTPTPTPTPTPIPTPTPVSMTVSVTTPTNNSTFSLGTSVTVGATASEQGGIVSSITIAANSKVIGTDTSAPYSVVWSNMGSGVYSVTATARDGQGLSVTSNPVTVKISKTLKRVRNNQQSISNLSNSYSSPVNGDALQPSAAIDLLVTDLEQTYNDFNEERSMFNSESQIDKYLLASVLLARSSAALSREQSSNTGVNDRLKKIDAYLSFCDDLIVSDSISPQSLNKANHVNARTDLLIAQPSTGPIGPSGFRISPNEVAKIDTTLASPFTMQTAFATSGLSFYELADVSVTIAGKAAALLTVSPTQITFVVPSGLGGGLADVVVTSRDGSIFDGTAAVVGLNPVILGLLGDTSGQAAVQDAIAFQSGAFSTTGAGLYGLDSRTRVAIWASGISTGITNIDPSNDLFMGLGRVIENLSESVKVEARTSNGTVYLLPVEFAGTPGTLVGLDQVNAVLVPELRGAGTVQLTIIAGGVRSNTMTITVQ